jgi:type IV pilus assembly protein PilV
MNSIPNLKQMQRPLAKRQRGFNLVELLVALLVLSLGLAGIAALLITGMTTSNAANLNSLAVTHVQSGVEMMRGNLEAYVNGWYAGANTSGAATTAIACSGANGCTPAEQANNDFALWRERLQNSMPDGQGFICMDSTPEDGQPAALACDGNGSNVIKIFWRDARDQDSLGTGEDFQRLVTAVLP